MAHSISPEPFPFLHVIRGGVSDQQDPSRAVLTDLVFSGISHEEKGSLKTGLCPCRRIMCASVDFSGSRATKERAPLLQAQGSNPTSPNNVKTI